MDNYIIIKTNDGIVKFEGDLINCNINNTSKTTTAYGGMNNTALITFTTNKSIKIEAEIIPTENIKINNIQVKIANYAK